MAKKRNPQDATTRNVKASAARHAKMKSDLADLKYRVKYLEAQVRDLDKQMTTILEGAE